MGRARPVTPAEVNDLTRRLQTRGQAGNALTGAEQSRLNEYLRSDPGRELVSSLNQEQIDKKWQNVGEPLSRIEWLRDLRQADPAQVTEIVAQAMKLYNQNELRGERLITHLQNNELTAAETRDWIGSQGISGLNPAARQAIVTGRDNAIAGAQLMSALELGEGRLAQAWQREVHEMGNSSLYEGFNSKPYVQLLDAMMRSPAAGRTILDHVDNDQPPRGVSIRAARPNAALEMSRVELGRTGDLTVTSPNADIFEMTREGWNRNGVPMQVQQGREVDAPDHTDGFRLRPQMPGNEPNPDQAEVQDQPKSLLDRLYEAAVNKDDKAMDAALLEYGQSPVGQQFQREIAGEERLWLAEVRQTELQAQLAEQQRMAQQMERSGPVMSM